MYNFYRQKLACSPLIVYHSKVAPNIDIVFYLTKTYVTLSGTPKKYKGVPLFQRDAKK